ncbi:MAG: DciA family protein [Aeromicrobium erythreum]
MSEPQDPVPDDGPADGEVERDPLELARRVADGLRTGGKPVEPRRPRRARPSPRRTSREDPTDLASVLGEVVRERGWDEQLAAQRVFTDWASIVGEEVAQHSTVEGYADGIVAVRTTSTAWATQLRLLAPRIVAKLNAELGDGSVLRVEVRGPQAPSWVKGRRTIRGARGPRDTYG